MAGLAKYGITPEEYAAVGDIIDRNYHFRLTPERKLRRVQLVVACKVWREALEKSGGFTSKYQKMCRESEGFDLRGCTEKVTDGLAQLNVDFSDLNRLAEFALEENNKKTGMSLKLIRIVRVNVQYLKRSAYYMTIKTSTGEANDEQLKLYRAKVWRRCLPPVDGKNEDEYELEIFKEVPPKEQIISVKKSRKRKREKRLSKRPFNVFVRELRSSEEFRGERYHEVLKVASERWKDLKAEEHEKVCPSHSENSTHQLPTGYWLDRGWCRSD